MATAQLDANRPDRAHPRWCVGMRPACNGRFHQSAPRQVPGDPVSGDGVAVSLRGKDRLFIALDFALVEDNPVALGLAMDVAKTIQDQQLDRDEDGGRTAAIQDPDDPELVTDPHGHDLTLEQAHALWNALGELLASASAGDTPTKPALRLVDPTES